jgi:hypothetical protein
MKVFYILLLLLLLPSTIAADVAPKGMKEFNKRCPAPKLCPDLEKYYQQCKKQPDTEICKKFIETMKKLSPVYDCQRDFDRTDKASYIVPAIWICNEEKRREDGNSYLESYYDLLSKLRSSEAKEFFSSPLFRSTLDGALAEEYYHQSEELEKKLKKKRK